MEHIIIYGSQYGSSRGMQKMLSEQTGIPAVSYKDAPDLSGRSVVVYLGSLYAGGVLGLSKTLRGFSLQDGQKLILVTVGLADPCEQEKPGQYPRLFAKAAFREAGWTGKGFPSTRQGLIIKSFPLGHRTVMKQLYQSLRRIPMEKQTAEKPGTPGDLRETG